MSDIKPPLSDARLAANRANALKSTGPRTAEGKAKSSRNALTHGLCARTIDVPDEDPALIAERYEAWKPELNPGGSASGDYLVLLAARKSIRLDRCHVVHEATVAQLARDAVQARLDARMVDVEALVRLLPTDPDLAVRRLKLTPEGCDALLAEWRMLELPLAPPPHWDNDDHGRICRLLGLVAVIRGKAPSPFFVASNRIAEHRDIAHKLWLNECPKDLSYFLKYTDPMVHARDKERLPWLAELSSMAVDEIRAVVDREVAALEALKLELIESERQEIAEATYRARFDASEPGKLLRRYEAEAERSLYRAMKEARELNREQLRRSEAVARMGDPSGRPSRNEPKASGPSPWLDDVLGSPPLPFSAGVARPPGPGGPTHKR